MGWYWIAAIIGGGAGLFASHLTMTWWHARMLIRIKSLQHVTISVLERMPGGKEAWDKWCEDTGNV